MEILEPKIIGHSFLPTVYAPNSQHAERLPE